MTLVARPGLSTVEELAGVSDVVTPRGTLESGDPGAIPAVLEGAPACRTPAPSWSPWPSPGRLEGRDERWLDLCAGPGGKAALLAALADQQGARLLANELQPHRAILVAQALRATGGEVVVGDGTRPPWAADAFDRVLVDAPCSGLGALRRRPESRWRRRPEDVEDLVPLQRALLDSAIDSVRPGGVVLYATCSPVVAETAGVVQDVLAGRSDVRLEDALPLVPEADDAASAHLDGAVQLWPHRHDTDAMFLALLRRSLGRLRARRQLIVSGRIRWSPSTFDDESGGPDPNARTPRLLSGSGRRSPTQQGNSDLADPRELVVDQHDVAAGAVEEARGDGRAVAGRAVHPDLAGRDLVETVGQLVHGDVEGAGEVAGSPLLGASYVQHDGVRCGRVRSEAGPVRTTQAVQSRPTAGSSSEVATPSMPIEASSLSTASSTTSESERNTSSAPHGVTHPAYTAHWAPAGIASVPAGGRRRRPRCCARPRPARLGRARRTRTRPSSRIPGRGVHGPERLRVAMWA